jgi:hypothetical protein
MYRRPMWCLSFASAFMTSSEEASSTNASPLGRPLAANTKCTPASLPVISQPTNSSYFTICNKHKQCIVTESAGKWDVL